MQLVNAIKAINRNFGKYVLLYERQTVAMEKSLEVTIRALEGQIKALNDLEERE